MKLTSQKRDIKRSGDFPEQTFRIAANVQAFQILSDGLYTDPRLAIVRELSTNAADAHIAVGKADVPFDVHLPNSMEPWFAIRDFGPSLDHDAILNVYTVYFESINRESEEATGGFGLGSKSPFAYTDMFTVVAYLNGEARTYSAFKAETGEPTIALVNTQSTDEPDGLEVRLDTRPGDQYEFQRNAESVFRFFPVKPNFTGARVEFEEEAEPVYEGDGWAIYDGDANAAGKISVVMGKVCYAVSENKIEHKLGRSAELVLYVPVGECQPAVSREELQYDKATVAAIQKRINEAQEIVNKKIQSSLGHCNSLLERLIALKQFGNLLNFSATVNSLPTAREGVYTLRKAELRGDKLFVGQDRFESHLRPYSGSQYAFVECDVEEPGSIRQGLKNNLRHWIRNQERGTIVYLATIENAARFAKMLGEPAIKLTEIPQAPRNNGGGGSNGGNRTYIKQIGDGWARRMSEKWTNVDEANVTTTKAACVQRRGYHVVFMGVHMDPSEAQRIAASIGIETVYGLPMNRYEKLRDGLGLKDLEVLARKAMETFVTTANDMTRAVWHHDSYNPYESSFLNGIDGLSETCTNVVAFLRTEQPPHEWRTLLQRFDLTLPEAPDYLDLFRQRYPLISNINLRYADLKDVLEYIKMKNELGS